MLSNINLSGKTNVIADALARMYALLTSLDTKLLGVELIKDLYASNINFKDIYAL